MDRQPNGSCLKCIDSNCQTTPNSLLVGRHQKGFEIQIMHCSAHLAEAQNFAQTNYSRVTFRDWQNPNWLRNAQKQELQTRKP